MRDTVARKSLRLKGEWSEHRGMLTPEDEKALVSSLAVLAQEVVKALGAAATPELNDASRKLTDIAQKLAMATSRSPTAFTTGR